MSDYQEQIKQRIFDQATFVKANFNGRRRGYQIHWQRVTVRPVEIRGRRHLQFSYFTDRRDVTQNYAGDKIAAQVEALLQAGFANIYVQSIDDAIQINVNRKGQATVVRHQTAVPSPPALQHDRSKDLILPGDRPDPFLQAIGLMTQDGRIRASASRKFRQINEFLKLAVDTGELAQLAPPVRIVDCGCGSAHLTFAVYHYLNHILGRPAQLTGIDTNAELLQRQTERAESLGWDGLTFVASSVIDFHPETPPSIVIALHACDTATDEALAQAVRWGAKLILSAPCCHHHLQAQLDARLAPAAVRPLLEQGILKERLGDVLTDTLRALLLKANGYRTDVVEFVSPEHTSKNLLIRAVKTDQAGNVSNSAEFETEYEALKGFWGVEPYLETLLREA
ncbi:MAG: SAM-dependent methyltransferase [Anaerolineae bacterium]|nr:SAM-dependent methyltransferase [Anaerolineae bacterium]